MAKPISKSQALKQADLAVFTPNAGQSPADYADAQMKGRGNVYANGPFKDTGKKLVAAQAVGNGVAFVTLSRVNLIEAEKPDVKGFQITVYDLAGSIISQTPLDDSAPKGSKRGYAVFGETCAEVSGRDDLIYTAIRGVADTAKARYEELEKLLESLPAPAAAEAPAEPATAEA